MSSRLPSSLHAPRRSHPVDFMSFMIVAITAALSLIQPVAAAEPGLKSGGFGASLPTEGGLALPSTLTPPPHTTAKDFIVAVVNKELVTNNEVVARIRRIEREAKQSQQQLPARATLIDQVVELLINERAQLTYARDSGIKIDDAEVDRAVQSVAEQNQLTLPQLTQQIKSEGLDLSRLRTTLREQLMLERVRGNELQARTKITDSEVEDEFERQKSQTQTSYNIAHLLVAVPDKAKPAEIEAIARRAQSLLTRARADGSDFAALVQQHSDAERNQGGAIGLRTPDRLPEPFVQAVKDLRVGDVAPQALRSNAGFHILKLVDKQTLSSPAAASQTQSHARHILLQATSFAEAEQARQALKRYKRQIEKGEADFASLARAHSQDGSAAQGGDLGWTAPGQFVPEFETVMDGLRPGQISEPIVSRFGVHLIQLLERKQTTLSREQQLDTVRKALRSRKQEQAYADWAQEIRARAYVERRDPPLVP